MYENILDTIKSRVSCRTFSDQKLTMEKVYELIEFSHTIKPPFKTPVYLSACSESIENTSTKYGTYGVITGAKAYLVGSAEKTSYSPVDFGYFFEAVLLKAVEMGLGTCWLGGTFTRSRFAKAAGLQDHQELICISPLGYPEDGRTLADRLTRRIAQSHNRKPWNYLFFDEDFNQCLTPDTAGDFQEALEMVRIGPSASNKQPWRIVKRGDDIFHFYLERNTVYNSLMRAGKIADLPRVDLGIAMFHFEQAVGALNLGKGQWKYDKPDCFDIPRNIEYIATWKFSG